MKSFVAITNGFHRATLRYPFSCTCVPQTTLVSFTHFPLQFSVFPNSRPYAFDMKIAFSLIWYLLFTSLEIHPWHGTRDWNFSGPDWGSQSDYIRKFYANFFNYIEQYWSSSTRFHYPYSEILKYLGDTKLFCRSYLSENICFYRTYREFFYRSLKITTCDWSIFQWFNSIGWYIIVIMTQTSCSLIVIMAQTSYMKKWWNLIGQLFSRVFVRVYESLVSGNLVYDIWHLLILFWHLPFIWFGPF